MQEIIDWRRSEKYVDFLGLEYREQPRLCTEKSLLEQPVICAIFNPICRERRACVRK